jgi:hypothetical protein
LPTNDQILDRYFQFDDGDSDFEGFSEVGWDVDIPNALDSSEDNFWRNFGFPGLSNDISFMMGFPVQNEGTASFRYPLIIEGRLEALMRKY